VDAARLPDPAEPVPAVAWPTVALFFGGLGVLGGSTALGIEGTIPVPVAVLLNAAATYMFFTVLHDAMHRSLSRHAAVNDWFGRVSAPLVAPPFISYSVFRFVHMQHHRFTNHDETQDPDAYSSNGPAWSWPLRWATQDIRYWFFYFPRIGTRPRGELIELGLTAAIVVGIFAALISAGFGMELLVYCIIPTRINILFLGFAFDFLPHHGLEATPQDDRFKTTRNRVGLERLMNPILLYQNYHLVHHLHPLIPFYRYLRVWRRNEESYLEQDTPLSTIGGRRLSVEEYRRRRGLDS
jgi:fatty acid desaturase